MQYLINSNNTHPGVIRYRIYLTGFSVRSTPSGTWPGPKYLFLVLPTYFLRKSLVVKLMIFRVNKCSYSQPPSMLQKYGIIYR